MSSNKRGGGSKAFWTMLKKTALFFHDGFPKQEWVNEWVTDNGPIKIVIYCLRLFKWLRDNLNESRPRYILVPKVSFVVLYNAPCYQKISVEWIEERLFLIKCIPGWSPCPAHPARGCGDQLVPAQGGEHDVRTRRSAEGSCHCQRASLQGGRGEGGGGGAGGAQGELHLPHRPWGDEIRRWENAAEAEKQEVLGGFFALQQNHTELVLQKVRTEKSHLEISSSFIQSQKACKRIKKHLREDDLDNLVEENMEEEERSRKESSKSHSSTSSADSVVSEQSSHQMEGIFTPIFVPSVHENWSI